jgi:UDP-N-acetyl-D-mannosaminuronic acid dehydrogenase
MPTQQHPAAAGLGPAAARLSDKIEQRSAVVGVVGLGYVGLTAACALAAQGYRVLGVDTDAPRVEQIGRGRCPFPNTEPVLPELLAEQVRAGRLRAAVDHAALAEADVILVVVQTPVDAGSHAPVLDALESAVRSVGRHLRPGCLVVVESTVPPGTMHNLVVPLLEQTSGLSATTDFLVGCCPERVMPGRLLANLEQYSRVMGGWTAEAGQVGAQLYRTLTRGSVDVTSCATAELVKTVENAYRDVQIAFANEVALLCESYGADVYEVRELVNKSPFRAMHLPGAGVGGHCIPKDPWLLVANAGPSTPVRLIPAARSVNDAMPRHVGCLAAGLLADLGQSLAGARIAILGYAYLEDSDDARNSPTADLVSWLQTQGASVAVHDPLVPGCERDLEQVVAGADCLVVMVRHSAYRSLDLARLGRLMRRRVLVDGRHLVDGAQAAVAGFAYRCLGIGPQASLADDAY